MADRDDPAGAKCGFYADVTGYVNKRIRDYNRQDLGHLPYSRRKGIWPNYTEWKHDVPQECRAT